MTFDNVRTREEDRRLRQSIPDHQWKAFIKNECVSCNRFIISKRSAHDRYWTQGNWCSPCMAIINTSMRSKHIEEAELNAFFRAIADAT